MPGLVALALAGAACRPQHVPAARKAGMVMSIGGVVGILAAGLASRFTGKGVEMVQISSAVSVVGILTFAAGDLSDPTPTYRHETIPERNRRWARILTERAAGAARDGRCPRVRRLEVRVRRYDPEVHDFVFMRDPEILRCLTAPAAPREPTEPPEPPEPPEPTEPTEPAERPAP